MLQLQNMKKPAVPGLEIWKFDFERRRAGDII